MKRMLACLIAALMVLALVPSVAFALDKGELEIVTDPETITCEVGEVVKVNFYLYPNLAENLVLNSIQGVLLYDSEMLTYGAINTKDEEQNLKSFMGKSTVPAVNTTEPGEIRFAYIDAYGWKEQGFWIQVEFRIEKEGASAFVFNGIRYSGFDTDAKKSEKYYIDPIQAGAISTNAEEPVPTDAAAEMTYEPLTAEIDDTPQNTPTPRPTPQNSGQTVPVTSSLPLPSGIDTPLPQTQETPALVTPAPAVTSMPITTRAPSKETKAPASTATAAPAATATAAADNPATVTDPTQAPSEQPNADAPTDAPSDTPTDAPISLDPTAEENPDTPKTVETETQPPQETQQSTAQPETINPQPEPTQPNKMALTIAVIAGIAVVILLAVLAIVLILVRKKRMDAMNDDE